MTENGDFFSAIQQRCSCSAGKRGFLSDLEPDEAAEATSVTSENGRRATAATRNV